MGHSIDHWKTLGTFTTILDILPFALLLLLIAALPLHHATAHRWERNSVKFIVAVLFAASGILLYVLPTHDWLRVGHTYLEYAAFLSLLASLFIISGGIRISGAFAGFPYINTLFLGIGALLANVLGTTGASMLLIRPLLYANRLRRNKTHIVVFFIFIVSNCAGLLTPLGDPPLYLGFLRGVPFDWTLGLWKQWSLTILILLFVFHLVDERMFDREDIATKGSLVEDVNRARKKVHIEGLRNAPLLLGVLLTILVAGYAVHPWLAETRGAEAAEIGSKLFQIVVMGLLALLSLRITPKAVHKANEFHFGPILEVAALFFGIFGAMIPALAILEAKAASFGLTAPWQYFWSTGVLSSFLDNAPTYLTFATLAASQSNVSATQLGELAAQFPHLLAAVSCGAVFMGAVTYIGNGPNFMVKAIAEHSKVKMPSFGGYMLWSLGILFPLFMLQTLLFFL